MDTKVPSTKCYAKFVVYPFFTVNHCAERVEDLFKFVFCTCSRKVRNVDFCW